MKEASLKPVIEKLENLFSKFNEKFYNGELQTPVITVSPDTTKGAYGWCTAWKAWSVGEQKKVTDLATLTKEALEAMKKDDGFYEINICAEHLARPFEQVAETLLHEMVHLYNLQIGIQDTSRGGTNHNKKYKEAAEQHGLTVEKDAKYGWTKTSLNDEAKAFIQHQKAQNQKNDIQNGVHGTGGDDAGGDDLAQQHRKTGDAAGRKMVGEFEEVDSRGHQKGAQGEQGEIPQGFFDAIHGKDLFFDGGRTGAACRGRRLL